jgi:hypothetical protein
VFLGELNARITGISAMTNSSDFCESTIPLFLFHLLEFDDGCEIDIDVDAYNQMVLEHGAIGVASQVILKYTDDPLKNPSAKRYDRLTFDQVLTDRLNVMDATSIVMCRDNNLPLQVFNLHNAGDLLRIVDGEDVGTVVSNG